MNRIRIEINRETNYVYHMLSVMKCGYDNDYGKKYRSLYTEKELTVFEENRQHITVRGGEHCGFLYGIMAGIPALGERPAEEHYRELMDIGCRIKDGNVPEGVHPGLIPYTDAIVDMAQVMLKHYDEYTRTIWPKEKPALEAYGEELAEAFRTNGFTDKAEKLVGPLGSEFFTATLVGSISGGPEAIDISREKDVFGIGRPALDTVRFISHEYIIYLLFEALKGMDAFERMETWPLTEGLAEYYLTRIYGGDFFSGRLREIRQRYESIPGAENLSPKELYAEAMQSFGVVR